MATSQLPQITMTKVLGNVPYLYKFCQDLRLPEIINEIVPGNPRTDQTVSVGETITAMVVNRLTAPRPLYQIQDWARASGFDYYFPGGAKVLNDDRLGRTLDRTEPFLPEIQEAFVLNIVTRYGIDPSLIHYDITSIFFEGEYKEVDWITLGYSRDQKPDKVQINLGLNITNKEGIPLFWTELPGNTNDTSTVIENMTRLKERFPRATLIQIGDRAMFSGEIYAQARTLSIDLIAPLKGCTAAKELLRTVVPPDLPLVRYRKDNQTVSYRLGEYELQLDETAHLPPLRALVVWSRAKAEQARRLREKKIARRRQELAELRTKLNRPYYRTHKVVSKKLTRIMGKDPVNDGFTVVLGGTDHALTVEVHEDVQAWDAQGQQDGLYILVTTVPEELLGSWEVFDLYKNQGGVEWKFRALKNPLKVRPLFVHLPARVRALVCVVMLALVVYSLLELQLKRQQLPLSPQQLLQRLSGLVLIQMCLPDQSLHFMLSPPNPNDLPLLQALEWQQIPEWVLQRTHKRVKGLEVPIPPRT